MRALSLRFGSVTERLVDGGADGRNTTAAVVAMTSSRLTCIGRWSPSRAAYDLTLDARTAGSPTEWNAANRVWTQPGLVLRDEYLDVLTGAYGSPLAEVDFGTPPGAARELINGWIADETSGLIPELFPDRSFDASTRMVLVNAVAMDAPWEFPFDPAATGPGPFTLIDGTSANVPMMHYDEYLPSLWTENLQAVELPYGGGALSMVVIAPTDLAAFEADLTAESVAAVIDQIQDGGIHLSMPKWTARTHAQLNDTLSTLGMPTAFSGSSAASPTREPHPDTFRFACTHDR